MGCATSTEADQGMKAQAGSKIKPKSPKQSESKKISTSTEIPSVQRRASFIDVPKISADFFSKAQARVQEDSQYDSQLGSSISSISREESVSATQLSFDAQALVEWKKGQCLGTGSFGEVYLGLNEDTGKLMAVKVMELGEKLLKSNKRVLLLQREIDLLRSMKSPYIVNYLGVQTKNHNLEIFLEFVAGGSIASLLKKFGRFNEKLTSLYTRQMLMGLAYLHRHHIVHRDIKGGNILVDISGTCKLADFGASLTLQDLKSEGKPDIQGTPYWMAPEVIRQQPHGRKVDIWSLGCTVIEMVTGSPPWCGFEDVISTLYHIASTTKPPELPSYLSANCKDFILKCLDRNPVTRSTAKQLLKHPFVTIDKSSYSGNELDTPVGVMEASTEDEGDSAGEDSPIQKTRSLGGKKQIKRASRGQSSDGVGGDDDAAREHEAKKHLDLELRRLKVNVMGSMNTVDPRFAAAFEAHLQILKDAPVNQADYMKQLMEDVPEEIRTTSNGVQLDDVSTSIVSKDFKAASMNTVNLEVANMAQELTA